MPGTTQLAAIGPTVDPPGRAFSDSLTGLPDRRVLDRWPVELIGRAASSIRGVLWVDIDALSGVNDVAGYAVGDALLVQFAARLQEHLRPGDVLVRLGGDEFALGLADVDIDTATAIGDRVVDLAAEPFRIGTQTVNVTASAGLGISGQLQAEVPVGRLLSLGCAAMREAKASGRGRLHCLSDTSPAAAGLVERHDIGRRIKPALATGQFEMHYQPIFDVATGQVNEVEALMRWNDTQLGRLLPASFIQSPNTPVRSSRWVDGHYVKHASKHTAGNSPEPHGRSRSTSHPSSSPIPTSSATFKPPSPPLKSPRTGYAWK